ncbi:hypothetical protein [Streptomyces sp. NRRL S-813]|uniref:hypothetical protein n=1 Tax=Streptomyces sp. NRRL S-813 TaxID=1463919 RepID=UPI0004C16A52|nr:hypothetical protein [Streptomyces sp. NRRL S-813]
MSFDLGDVVRLSTSVRNANDAPADAGSMSLTITLPDGSDVTVPSVTPETTGVYTYDYPTTQAGRHSVRWLATGDNAMADTDVFNVREATPPQLFSLAEAKAKLGIPPASTSSDDELREFIEATTQCVEFFVGPVVRRTVQQVVPGDRDVWVLHTMPVLSVTAITPLQTWQQAIDPSVLDIDGATGLLRRKDGLWFYSGDYRVTYTAGRAIVPPNVTLAARLILQHLWRTNYGASRGLGAIGGGDDFLVTEQVPGFGYAIPNRALQLLQGDRQAGGFA